MIIARQILKRKMKAIAVKITVLLAVYFAHNTKGILTVHPLVKVQAEGVHTLFHCSIHSDRILSINWRVNGSTLIQNPRSNIAVQVYQSNTNNHSAFQSILTILALPEYNGTVAQCVVYPSRNESDSVTLIVQGPLQSVSNLHFVMETVINTSIHISWTAPFSLNLTTAEPDIQYCVDVYNVTGGGNLVESRCDITETFYTYTPDNPSPDHMFNFTVTPRSNVEGALNGTRSEPVQGYVIDRPPVISSEIISYHTNSILSPITWQYPSEVIRHSLGRVQVLFSIKLISVDNPANPSQCNCPATSEVNGATIELTLQWCLSCGLQRHRVYNFTISAINNAGTSISNPAELSTHDVQNITAIQRALNQSNRSEIDITCSYLSGSTPTGLLAIISSLTNLSDVHYVALDRNGKTDTSFTISNLVNDQYVVSVYDRGEDHLPENWPAGSKVVSQAILSHFHLSSDSSAPPLTESVLQPPPNVDYTGSDQICVNCSFSEPSVNGCVVIVHSAHDTNNLLGKQLKVYSINKSVMYDCIHVDKDEYYIAVFGLLNTGLERVPAVNMVIRREDIFIGLVTTAVEPGPMVLSIIVSAVSVPVVLVLCLSLGIIITVALVRKWKKTKTEKNNLRSETDCRRTFPGIEQPNIAYNFVHTFFKKNEAYNKFWPRNVRPRGPPVAPPVMEMERIAEPNLHTEQPPSSPDGSDSSYVHIYDEPVLPPAKSQRFENQLQLQDVVYAEVTPRT